jgi:hypothetical protein
MTLKFLQLSLSLYALWVCLNVSTLCKALGRDSLSHSLFQSDCLSISFPFSLSSDLPIRPSNSLSLSLSPSLFIPLTHSLTHSLSFFPPSTRKRLSFLLRWESSSYRYKNLKKRQESQSQEANLPDSREFRPLPFRYFLPPSSKKFPPQSPRIRQHLLDSMEFVQGDQ